MRLELYILAKLTVSVWFSFAYSHLFGRVNSFKYTPNIRLYGGCVLDNTTRKDEPPFRTQLAQIIQKFLIEIKVLQEWIVGVLLQKLAMQRIQIVLIVRILGKQKHAGKIKNKSLDHAGIYMHTLYTIAKSGLKGVATLPDTRYTLPMSTPSSHTQAVIDYYNNTRAEYRLLWRNRHNLGLHFGYYDTEHQTHDSAVLNLNAQLARLVDVTANDTVLDAGCGVGGSPIWLAKHIGCNAIGISITPWQIARAEQNAQDYDVADKTRFIVGDFAEVPLADEEVTVFWGLESIVHAEDKQAVLDEAFRVLAPGGRLVIAEYLLSSSPLSPTHAALLREWTEGWSMPQLETDQSYTTMLTKAGFHTIEIADWTPHVLPSLHRLERYARLFTRVVPVLSALRLANKDQRRNLSATTAQMKLLRDDVWGYKVVTAVKPQTS